MSAVLSSPVLSGKLAETAARVRERCADLQDTLDTWIDVGRDLDSLACAWIADQGANVGKVATIRRKKSGAKRVEGLRKRCIGYLESLVGSTGFTGKSINQALQLFALEQTAGWIQQLKSEAKARELKSLARWHWEGCKLTREGERSIKLIHEALCSAASKVNGTTAIELLSAKAIREIVRSITGKESKAKNTARAAAVVFFNAIEGNDRTPPADRADVLSWLAVLLTESPLAAEIIAEAVETHLDAVTAAQTPVSKVA
jgi:hypothetical protein